ncbi:MAG: phosphatase PAP2 family protein [Acidimicrobiales bacterium]|nr:phosphatase PAP2 family protein [Acidimicrobiales bacterium]
MIPPTDPDTDGGSPADAGLKWWVEGGITIAFYIVYSMVRNQFGSALGGDILEESFDNAIRIIDIEKAMGLYHEEWIQRTFLDADAFIVFWNAFYGSFHFGVTIFAMVWLFLKFPQRYIFMRSALAATTGVALIGFAFFPLMPPRLLAACTSEYGACALEHEYVDTLVDPGGLWNFENGPMESISNQYAAMPSLHIAWATWCALALYPVLRRRWARISIVSYPFLTLFAIVVTANHYWFDAIGGLMALAAGLVLARPLSRLLPGRVLVPASSSDTLDDG